jgi:dUTP pyrophosphatase
MIVKYYMEEGCDDLVPKKGRDGDACFDLHSRVDMVIPASGFAMVPTGIHTEFPDGYEIVVRGRSGLAVKKGIYAHVGTVDSNYRGEICAILFNFGAEDFNINRGDRIAQFKVNKVENVILLETEKLTETERGSNGFGSSGK